MWYGVFMPGPIQRSIIDRLARQFPSLKNDNTILKMEKYWGTSYQYSYIASFLEKVIPQFNLDLYHRHLEEESARGGKSDYERPSYLEQVKCQIRNKILT
jgi:hypothetical protein